MPLYDFKCVSCGNIHEELVKMGTTESVCPKCGAAADKQSIYAINSTGLPNGHIGVRAKKTFKETDK